jgi:hypothetical protein
MADGIYNTKTQNGIYKTIKNTKEYKQNNTKTQKVYTKQ